VGEFTLLDRFEEGLDDFEDCLPRFAVDAFDLFLATPDFGLADPFDKEPLALPWDLATFLVVRDFLLLFVGRYSSSSSSSESVSLLL